jgi:hypothetical protein
MGMPIGNITPDAVFSYPFRDGVKLTGMVEIDMGTQTNPLVWKSKFSRYSGMMKSGDLLKVTGETRGRVLVVTPDEGRSDFILKILAEMLKNAEIERDRFWITEKSTLDRVDLTAAIWRVPEGGELRPLVPEGVL